MIKRSNAKEMFIIYALKMILKDLDVEKSYHAELRKECESALQSIKSECQAEEKTDASAEKYFRPFELACQSKSPRIVVTSLHCLQKLIEYGHLTGNCTNDTGGLLIDKIIETICDCFTGQQTDERILLEIIKAFLTVGINLRGEVHEATCLKAVKTSYSIYLACKNIVKPTLARAILTEMLKLFFIRMEMLAMDEEVPKDEFETVELCEVDEIVLSDASCNQDIDESVNVNVVRVLRSFLQILRLFT